MRSTGTDEPVPYDRSYGRGYKFSIITDKRRIGGRSIRQGGEKMIKVNLIEWIKAAGVRAVKTIAQTAIATIGTTAVLSEVEWLTVVSASLLAGLLSLLTSIAGLPELK